MKARIIYPDDKKPWLKITSAKIIPPKNPQLPKVNSMNILKITSIVAVSLIGALAVVAILGFQLTEIIAEEVKTPGYLTAEGVTITGDFKFRDGEELVSLQVFTQTKGFQRTDPFIFTMQKVVGNTTLLHKHADVSFLFRNSEVQKQDWDPFDVDIIISQGGDLKRIFTYTKCFVDDYNVTTLRDNEEGYFNKGFAVVENYILECRSMQIHNPALEKMMATLDGQKANTTSSTDLEKSIPTWRDYYNN
ncbi:MAG: hypothetical protein WD966_03365 [Nitrosopumilaceae archaeon]